MNEEKTTHPVTLPQAIRATVDFALSKVNTCMPGSIEKYDGSLRQAHVKPLLKRSLPHNQTQALPVIPGVPVHFMLSSSKGGLRFDLKAGDTGLLLFCQRSLDEWLAQGGDVDPKDVRRFALTDAIFIPGLVPFTGTSDTDIADSLVLDYGGASLRMHGGKLALGNDVAELLQIIADLLTVIVTGTNVGGPVAFTPPAGPGSIPDLVLKLNAIKGTL